MALTPAQKMKNLRDRRKAAGLCVTCGQRKARKNCVTCKPCNERAKRIVKESRAESK